VTETPTMQSIAPEAAEAVVTAPLPAPEPSALPTVRVKIHQGEDGTIEIDAGSNTVPGINAVVSHLDKASQKVAQPYVNSGYDLEGTIRKTRNKMLFQVWADAIGHAILASLSNKAGATFESQAIQEAAYLAVGDQLFRLSPVAMVKTNKALAAVRQRANDKARQVIKKLTDEAQMAADALVEDAKHIHQRAEEILQEVKGTCPMPDWARKGSIICRWNAGSKRWELGMHIRVVLEGFDTKFHRVSDGTPHVYSWPAKTVRTVKTFLWIPIKHDGSYAITSIMVDRHWPELPHISHAAACMSIGDAPAKLTNGDEFEQLKDSIVRCMKRVQLDSLRTSYSSWGPTFHEAIPDELAAALETWGSSPAGLAARLDAEHPVEDQEEGSTTWTTVE
jgi:hypothetical protein